MRHLTVGDKSVLTGDEVGDLLIRYTALLVQQRTADTVEIGALELTGAPTRVSLLLSEGLALVAETTRSEQLEPDNRAAEDFLRSRIDALVREQSPGYDDVAGTAIWNAEE